jgi:two-component system catabolic regulation response regulator CreB
MMWSMRQHLLVVEDEPAIAESLAYALERDGFTTAIAPTYAVALEKSDAAHLIVLDLMLPDGSGFDLIGRLRRAGCTTPIIVLSSRDAEADRVAALEIGADDYVTKPFSPREVVARVRAVLRRVPSGLPPDPAGALATGLRVEEETRRAYVGSSEIELTRVEFDLLRELLERPGRVLTRAEIIGRVWGDGYAITDRTVDSHVKALRRKVSEAGADGGLIETVRGVGYRVAASAEGHGA